MNYRKSLLLNSNKNVLNYLAFELSNSNKNVLNIERFCNCRWSCSFPLSDISCCTVCTQSWTFLIVFLTWKVNSVILFWTLAGVAQWTEGRPVNQGVTGWIPSQSTCLDCRPVSSREGSRGNETLMFLFLPPSPSLKINK